MIFARFLEKHSSNAHVPFCPDSAPLARMILSDFDTARGTDVEGRLWDAHLKLNTRFRKLLARVSRWPLCGGFARTAT